MVIVPLFPVLTMVTLGGGVTPLAKPVDKTFCVLCIMKDLVAPELPSVNTFLSITEELQALSIMSLVVAMVSKSFGLAGVVCMTGRTVVTL